MSYCKLAYATTPELAEGACSEFLLLNRVFSPQFVLPLGALWAFGLALRRLDLRWNLTALALWGTVATANYAVWPHGIEGWYLAEWPLFVAAFALSAIAFGMMPPPLKSGHDRVQAELRREADGAGGGARRDPAPLSDRFG